MGRDSELKVNGNIWVLDFSNWHNNHPGDNFMPSAPEHTYNGRVMTKLKANVTSPEIVRFADFSFTTPKNTIEDVIVIPKIVKEISKALANTGINLWMIMAAGIGVIVAAFIMLFIVKKHKKRDE